MATPLNNSVVKAFAILDLFDDRREEVTAGEVAQLLDLNAITSHRFLKTLTGLGVLYSPRRGAYRLGSRLVEYGEKAKSAAQLAAGLQPFLNLLAAETKESAMATTFDGTHITCIATAHSERAFTFAARVGARMEAYATANGKLWLAHASREALEAYLATTPLIALSTDTITERDAFLAELARIRQSGHATNLGEREEGLRAVGVAVIGRRGRMIAGMSVFAPAHRMDEASRRRALSLLAQNAEKAGTLFD